MFDTVAQIAFAVALILPGFLVVQLSERRRAAAPPGGDLELVLRGLVYALIIQALAVLVGWLPDLVKDLNGGDWAKHLDATALYALTVCVLVPTLVGVGLGELLQDAENRGRLSWWHYALGGRDARRAWDYTFSRHDGVWVQVFLLNPTNSQPPALLGRWERGCWAAQAPAEPDLYLQKAWRADAQGRVSREQIAAGPEAAVWVDAAHIARVEVLGPGQARPD